jgi:speckle-type POZ protein
MIIQVMCEQAMCLSLTNESACDTFILADLHSAEHLKTQAIEFINLHANEVVTSYPLKYFYTLLFHLQVMETEGWKILVKKHPQLLEEVFKALATQVITNIIHTSVT